MDSNDNNIKTQTNEVKNESDIYEANSKEKKVTVVLLIIVLALVLAIGIGVGFLFTGKSSKDNTTATTTNTSANNTVETKSGKKIDENKPWVYDADYCVNSENKKAVGMFEGEEFNTKDYLKAPYINVNSEYAKKANEEIKEMFDKLYQTYGDSNGDVAKAGELKYEVGNLDNILSVVITCREGVTNAGWSKEFFVYNINLDTMAQATFEEVYKKCGFESEAQLEEKVKITMQNCIEDISDNATWSNKDDLYYMDSKLQFNIIVTGHMSKINLVVKKDAESLKKEEGTISKEIIASGWAGSSMNRVRLYSNGNVYYVKFNGAGETEDCIIEKDLIAKNVDEITEKEGEHGEFEGVIVKGKNMSVLKQDSVNWISFEKIDDTTNTIPSANSEYNTAIEAMKKCLKDEKWLKENVYITDSQKIIDGDLSDQIVNFIICKGDKTPIVIIEVSSDNARYTKIVLVAYVNGTVKSEIINQGHIYHGGYTVDANKNVVNSLFMHMGDNSTSLHKITDGSIKYLGMYGKYEEYKDGKDVVTYYTADEADYKAGKHKNVSEAEYEKFKANLNEAQYKFVNIGTELNNQNVDEYVK